MLRQGLTNQQIADRLGITLDGAKYHVSEIMGKLGAGSREEAAAVVISGHRPWWLAALAPIMPLWRRFRVDFTSVAAVAGIGAVAAAVAGLAVLAFFVLRTGNDSSAPGANLSATATPQAFAGFARQLDAALQAGDSQFFIDSVVYENIACGTTQGPPGYPPSCQGLPVGATSPALPVSILNSEGMYEDPGQYAARVRAFVKNHDARLYATATRGVDGRPEVPKYENAQLAIAAGAEPVSAELGREVTVFTIGYDGTSWHIFAMIVGAPEVFLNYDSVQPGDDWVGYFATWERWQG